MGTLPAKIGLISLFVEDVRECKAFYEQTFGLEPFYEDDNSAIFRFENLMVNLLHSSGAAETMEPAVIAGPEAGSRIQIVVFVEDVNAVCAELTRNKVALLNGPIDRPWGKRTAAFADPAGHVWEIAQDIP